LHHRIHPPIAMNHTPYAHLTIPSPFDPVAASHLAIQGSPAGASERLPLCSSPVVQPSGNGGAHSGITYLSSSSLLAPNPPAPGVHSLIMSPGTTSTVHLPPRFTAGSKPPAPLERNKKFMPRFPLPPPCRPQGAVERRSVRTDTASFARN